MKIFTPNTKTMMVRQEGERVLLIYNGLLVCSLPWDAALELSAAIHTQAKRAEELANAERIAFDQALLLRIGAPFGITNNPTIQAEAAKEAAWNSKLRRALPGGIKSQEQVGTPAVIRHKPKGA